MIEWIFDKNIKCKGAIVFFFSILPVPAINLSLNIFSALSPLLVTFSIYCDF